MDRILYQTIQTRFQKGKTIILIGPRQVGKTTLLKKLQEKLKVKSVWLNADEADVRNSLEAAGTSTQLFQLIGKGTKVVFIDEAQQVNDIGLKLKIIHDHFPEIQVIATGSSSFELQNAMNEPLTGRKIQLNLYPVSYQELIQAQGLTEAKRQLETRIIYGSYPEIVTSPGNEKELLAELTTSYLYKDIMMLEGIRKPEHIEKIVRALAFQIGNEVSYNELAQTVGNIDVSTVEKYLSLLQQALIIYKLPAYSRNLRNEIKKGKKYYFFDTGIRNAIINNFASVELRMDIGALWENFLLNERMKKTAYERRQANTFFWRTKDQAEIDYIEEIDGKLHAYEFKWQKKAGKLPQSFQQAYPQHTFTTINQHNYIEFIT